MVYAADENHQVGAATVLCLTFVIRVFVIDLRKLWQLPYVSNKFEFIGIERNINEIDLSG
jgi:hypothetical protein